MIPNKTNIKDKYGNEVPARCPKCGGEIIPLPDVTGAISGGQCAQCCQAFNTVAGEVCLAKRYFGGDLPADWEPYVELKGWERIHHCNGGIK